MLSLHEILLRLTVAAVLGAVIGVERDLRRRPAGIRTSLFVCLATALFTILSGQIAHLFGAEIQLLQTLYDYSWFVGFVVAFALYAALMSTKKS